MTGSVTMRTVSTEAISYRLDVLGVDVADIVRSAGGWLYDRVAIGWDIRVTVRRPGDLRPLRVLGITAHDRSDDGDGMPIAMAASVAALAEDATQRADLAAALRRGQAEVTLWGDGPAPGFGSGARVILPVQHVLSDAARVFKAQALAAAGLDYAVAPVETFRTGNRTLLPVEPDLLPF